MSPTATQNLEETQSTVFRSATRLGASLGIASLRHRLPSQDSISLFPTATQKVAEAHATLWGNHMRGTTATDQCRPSKLSAKPFDNPVPTAMQKVLERQEIPLRLSIRD
jgi:hypothetical protein